MLSIYKKQFDYEDMKIAMVVEDFSNQYKEEGEKLFAYEDYEDLIELCVEIREHWKQEKRYETLTSEEFVYIQCYAMRYLENKFLIDRRC